jgi:DNA-binding protein HU-beta
MNKTELIAAVAEKTGMTKKDAERVINATLETVTASMVAGDKVQIFGFGTFDVKERAARTGRNPRTGETLEIAASKNVGFSAAKALKDAIK